MFMNRRGWWLGLAFACMATATTQADDSKVSAIGTAAVKVEPQTLRIQMDIVAQDKDIESALAKLKERRAAAELAFVELGFTKEALELGPPRVSTVSPQMLQILAMRRQMSQGNRGGKAPEPPVAMAMTVRGEMPLSGPDVEPALVLASTLVRKIRAADLSGTNSEEKSEEEEEAEAMLEDEPSYYPESRDPTEPVVIFVGKVAPEQVDQVFATAVARARNKAERLAEAAGLKLGAPLHLVVDPASSSQNEGSEFSELERIQQFALFGSSPMVEPTVETDESEAVGPRPDSLRYSVTVNAEFSAAVR
jgi:hypothetical protein